MKKFAYILIALLPVLSPESRAQSTADSLLEQIADKTLALRIRLYDFWRLNGPDPATGSFYGTLNGQGNPGSDNSKWLLAQSRHLYSFSLYYEKVSREEEVKTICDNLYQFMNTYLLDSASHEYYFRTNASGNVIDDSHQSYPESYTIQALTAYSRSFGDTLAAEEALKCFKALDRRIHDSIHGGYDQSLEPNYLIAGEKQTGTQMHLLEAIASLYELTNDSLASVRLEEMINITAHKIIRPEGYVRHEFYRDWTPIDYDAFNIGHCMGITWSLYDAIQILAPEDSTDLIAIVRKLGDTTLAYGYDTDFGGFYEQATIDGGISAASKTWWVQADGLLALYRLYTLTGDVAYLRKLDQTLNRIIYLQLSVSGEWYWSVDELGNPTNTTDMCSEWKGSFHTMRSMIFLSTLLEEYSSGVPYEIHPLSGTVSEGISVQVRPVPFNNELIVESASCKLDRISLYDASGRLWIETLPSGNTARLHVANLPHGVYVLTGMGRDGGFVRVVRK